MESRGTTRSGLVLFTSNFKGKSCGFLWYSGGLRLRVQGGLWDEGMIVVGERYQIVSSAYRVSCVRVPRCPVCLYLVLRVRANFCVSRRGWLGWRGNGGPWEFQGKRVSFCYCCPAIVFCLFEVCDVLEISRGIVGERFRRSRQSVEGDLYAGLVYRVVIRGGIEMMGIFVRKDSGICRMIHF